MTKTITIELQPTNGEERDPVVLHVSVYRALHIAGLLAWVSVLKILRIKR